MTKVTLEQLATMDMAQLAELSGASANDITNWMNRLSLTTRFAKTTQGKARKFNRDNAVEICLLARLVRAGMEPIIAAKRVASLFRAWEHGQTVGWVTFFLGEAEDTALPLICLDEPPTAEMLDGMDKLGVVFVLVNAARLVARVDEHFPEDEAAQ